MGSIKGIVKWYNARKGYGFITPGDKSDDVFVHAITLKDSGLNKLYTGSEVTFEVDQDEKGKRAKNLKVTKEVKPEIKTNKEGPAVGKQKTAAKQEKKEVKPETKTNKEGPAVGKQKTADKQEKKASSHKKPVKTESKKEKKTNKETKSK